MPAEGPVITTQCLRVPVLDGHLAAVFVKFKKKPTKQQIIDAWNNFKAPELAANLPSSPKQMIKYMEEPDRPQLPEAEFYLLNI